MNSTKEEIGSLLDALLLEMLHLVEEQAKCRVTIEKQSNGGQLLLAKARYIQGSQTVSMTQVPTEHSEGFNALCTVTQKSTENEISPIKYELQKHEIKKEEGYTDPMLWFGVLAPNSLRAAAEQFRKCLDLVVESANIQTQLTTLITNIKCLKQKFSELP